MARVQKNKKKQSTNRFKVGDKIVDFGQVYRIFKVEKRKNDKGLKERVLHFKPCFKNEKSKDVTCSIPEKNIILTKIRRPISKKELKKVFRKLSGEPKSEIKLNILKVKEILKFNSPVKTASILKKLWLDKKDKHTSFAASKQNLLDLSMRSLVEEIAYVSGTSLKQAKETIKKELGKSLKSS